MSGENVVTLVHLLGGGYELWGDGPVWPNDPANPREHGAVWPGYAPHRGQVAFADAQKIAGETGARIVIQEAAL